jgi:hypothetical protein
MSEKIAANRVNEIGRLDFIFNICWERIDPPASAIWSSRSVSGQADSGNPAQRPRMIEVSKFLEFIMTYSSSLEP